MALFGRIAEVGVGLVAGSISTAIEFIDAPLHIVYGAAETALFALPAVVSSSASSCVKNGLQHIGFGLVEGACASSGITFLSTPIQYLIEDQINMPIMLEISGNIWSGPHTYHPFSYEEFKPIIDKHFLPAQNSIQTHHHYHGEQLAVETTQAIEADYA
ncbi:hypothetical protein [Rickettsiales endosymbiont of Stachyamoeba lipophora]|uniref:hypothetical protein n=1 Tax=Rickettsiales endosymbiont of Stachyamoeba lipophora TaxID=2486578 RepID=UPI000F64FB34|nr:hypothetical protein [Rickettsiales endosymbiont of Stachyamoeba lipophora]